MQRNYLVFFFVLIFYSSVKSQTVKILFDATKAEAAANADWVIDANNHNLGYGSGPAVLNGGNESNPQQIPFPAQSGINASTVETYWNGALSNWGVDCVNSNYIVETLPYNGQITYNNVSNPQDLSNYKVFIICEPNIVFTSSEKTAILNFVQDGGGLFMISDHDVSDRNNDGWDSPHIWNDFMTSNAVQLNPFGMSFDYNDFSQTSTNIPSLPSDSILHGPAGNVTEVKWTNGTTLTINPAQNSTVRGVIYKTGSTFGNSNVMCAYARYGNGKVASFGDSSPCDDGTGDPNDGLFNGYTLDANGNHRELLMNITIWLATSNSVAAPVADFTANQTSVCLGQATTFTNNSTGSINGYAWNFGAGASPATANTIGPHNVTYSSGGTKSVSLTVTGPGGSNVKTRSNYITVNPNCTAADLGATLLVNPASVICPTDNQPLQVRIKNYGASTVNFSSTNVSLSIQITDPSAIVKSFTKTINSGSLVAGATTEILFDSTYDMISPGSYTFNSSTSYAVDANTSNDDMPVTVVSVSQGYQSDYTIVSEDMGTVSTTTTITQHETNNGFQNDNLTMSGSGDVRNTQSSLGFYTGASGGANVFLTNTVGKNFIIAGINTLSYNNLSIEFGVYKSTAASTSDLLVSVSTDGTTYSPLTMPSLPAVSGWSYVTVTGNIPATANLRILFQQNGTTTQYRVDDVLLSSSVTMPSVTAQSPVTFCQGGSVTLISSQANSYLWSNGMTTQSINVSASGNYYVTATNASGCTASSTPLSVVVNPVYNSNVNASMCPGSTYTLPDGTIVNSTGNYVSTLSSVAGCDSVINTNLTVINTNDNNLCTTDACDPVTKTVTHTAINVNDNNACTTDACDPSTGTITHSPININDNNACTTDACNPSTGNISHTPINTNDNNVCTTDACNTSTGQITHSPVNADDSNPCTIDGCDPLTGVYHNQAIEICGNGIDDNCNGSIDEGCSSSLHVKLFIEGFYLGNNLMQATIDQINYPAVCDTILIELHNSVSPYTLEYGASVTILTNGNADVTLPSSVLNHNYYIVIKHRSAIETWSSNPVLFSSSTSYNFSDAASKAFGNNMRNLGDGNYAFWSGDISDPVLGTRHQDGVVESQDYLDLGNAVDVILVGYTPEDITGDGVVESSDFAIMENNVSILVFTVRP